MSVSAEILFWVLIVPGTIFLGLAASYIMRKVSALVQWRVGPPICQPVYDIAKLMGKEILVPAEAQYGVFLLAPLVGLVGVLLLSVLLWHTVLGGTAFMGDVIVAVYLMVLPSLALILGSSASAGPHAALGTGREMKLVISYELPLVLSLVVVIIKSGGQLGLEALSAQPAVLSLSGMIAFLAALLCVQAKLGFVPFDMAESEAEISGGVIIEYSGALLATWKLMQAVMLVVLPLFLVMVFMGGFGTLGWSLVAGVGKYVLVLVLLILIKNTNPRVRIDQAMRFFWVYGGMATAGAVVLALLGVHWKIDWL